MSNSEGTKKSSSSSNSTSTASPTYLKPDVADANSLQFTVSSADSMGATSTFTYYAKNIGSPDIMMRIEYTDTGGEYHVYILNANTQQAWEETNGQWIDLSTTWTDQFSSWNASFSTYKQDLILSWSGLGDYNYTSADGNLIRIYDIAVNPSLPDSLFQHG